MSLWDEESVKILEGLTLVNIERIVDEKIVFYVDDGRVFELFHAQDCCEHVHIESVAGDLQDLVGTPLTLAEEASSCPKPVYHEPEDCSETWTFYRFATIKGYVTVRWLGSSNGYYSESVTFARRWV